MMPLSSSTIDPKATGMQMDSVRQKPDVPPRSKVWLYAIITAWSLVAVYIYMMQVMLPGVGRLDRVA